MSQRKKLFMDLEFTDLTQSAQLISIAVISEVPSETGYADDRVFYAESTDYAIEACSEFVEKNVLPSLRYKDTQPFIRFEEESIHMFGSEREIASKFIEWVKPFNSVEIWADCYAYDWVLFCSLFGGAMSVPKEIYYIPFDLSTLLYTAGIDPDIDRQHYADRIIKQVLPKHNALVDAFTLRVCYYRATRHLRRKHLIIKQGIIC